jgi:tripartite-type tricarboxylate transporter receptor subunit TctC
MHVNLKICSTSGKTVMGLVLALVAASASFAQSYPSKPIRCIVAAPPGGPADIVARLIGPKLTEAWGQPVVIDNRAGATGIIGTEMAARAVPDGYTIAVIGSGLATNRMLYQRVRYEPVRDFAPITQAISVPNILVVHPSVSATSVRELIQLAKAKPGELRFASAGIGSTGHLGAELLNWTAGVKMTHVPYKGGAPALVDLLGGQVEVLFSLAVAAMPHVKGGKVRALAVTSSKRSAVAPELPTVAESGFPGYEVTGWFGVLAPSGTPRTIVDKLNVAIVGLLSSREVQERLVNLGADPAPGTPQQFAAHIKSESQKWGRFIKEAGIRAD